MKEAQGNRRLDSWKEIAEHLGRDVRTVIRWEKEKALPIHRIPGGRRQGVFAYTGEIEDWMLGQSGAEAGETGVGPPAGHSSDSSHPLQTPASQGGWKFRISLGIAAGITVLTGGIFLWIGRAGFAAAVPPLERPLKFARADYAATLPRGIAAGDFNGDGKLDLAFTDSLHGSVVVLLGDGHGTFPRRVSSPTAVKSPEHLAVADFNGDGKLDVVLTSYFGGREVEVLLGNGDGSFRQHAGYDVGGRSRWVAAGDLNGDGQPDFAVAGSLAGKIFVRFGNGDGTFRDGGQYEAEWDVAAIELADLEGRGMLDIVAADYRQATGNSVSVYANKGDGTFAPRRIFSTGNGPLGLAVADLNRDGRPDIVTANFPFSGSILLAAGKARFAEALPFDAGRGNGFVAVADLDRDGLPDLVVLGEHSATASILLGDGRGRFSAAQEIPTGTYPDGAVIADFDGDRKLDLAILNTSGNSISVLLNRTATVSAWSWFAPPAASRAN